MSATGLVGCDGLRHLDRRQIAIRSRQAAASAPLM